MKKYTANYAFTNPNFVVQNLLENEIETQDKGLLFVLKNILQRGFPTILSAIVRAKLVIVRRFLCVHLSNIDNFLDSIVT